MGYVYLIEDRDNNRYKIGVTNDLEKRLRNLQTGNSNHISIKESFQTQQPFKLEKMLHNKFRQYQYNNEWYELPTDDVEKFLFHCETLNKIIISLKDNPFF